MQHGTITTLSLGEAANIAAQVTEAARNATYLAFRDTPYSPSDAAVKLYYKEQLSIFMALSRGTAGTTGTNSPNIIFNEEKRSTFFALGC